MPIVRIVSPREVTWDIYQQVQDKINTEGDPPEGLIVHTASEVDGKLKIVDVWESEEHAQRFGEQRLGPATMEGAGEKGRGPAIMEVAGEQVGGPPGPEQIQIYEIKALVKP